MYIILPSQFFLQMSSRLFKILPVLLLFVLAPEPQAHAQRTMNRQDSYSLCGLKNDSGYGGTLAYGLYTLNGIWLSGIRISDYHMDISTGDRIEQLQADAQTEYLFRILATRSRALNLYAGGGMFMGYEFSDPFDRLPEYIDTGLGKGSFAYGICASAQAEIFFCRRAALVIHASIPLNIISDSGWLHHEYGAGLRINL